MCVGVIVGVSQSNQSSIANKRYSERKQKIISTTRWVKKIKRERCIINIIWPKDMLRASCCFFCSGSSTCLEVQCEKKKGWFSSFLSEITTRGFFTAPPLPIYHTDQLLSVLFFLVYFTLNKDNFQKGNGRLMWNDSLTLNRNCLWLRAEIDLRISTFYPKYLGIKMNKSGRL